MTPGDFLEQDFLFLNTFVPLMRQIVSKLSKMSFAMWLEKKLKFSLSFRIGYLKCGLSGQVGKWAGKELACPEGKSTCTGAAHFCCPYIVLQKKTFAWFKIWKTTAGNWTCIILISGLCLILTAKWVWSFIPWNY